MNIYSLKKEDEMQNDDDFVAEGQHPLIPEGTYQVHCIGIGEDIYRGSYKLYVSFEILDEGQYNGTELFMAMNLSDSKTKKRFKKVPRGSKYYEQWVIANYNTHPPRTDKMSPGIFNKGYFDAVIRTVKPKFNDGTEKPASFHYSVVDYLKRRGG